MRYKVKSDTRPEETDTTSSRVYNYFRSNIEQTEVTDEMTNEKHICYTYDEEKIRKEDWDQYLDRKTSDAALQELIMENVEG